MQHSRNQEWNWMLMAESYFNLTISPGDCKAGVVEKD
jgi:hypothetical protein